MRTAGVLAAALLVLAACGTDAENDPTESPTPTRSASPLPDDPTLPTGSQPSRRLTGVVNRVPEDRCTVLTTDGSPAAWVLIGDVGGLADGDRVTVTGRADPDATTRCQQGPVFVVAEVD